MIFYMILISMKSISIFIKKLYVLFKQYKNELEI